MAQDRGARTVGQSRIRESPLTVEEGLMLSMAYLGLDPSVRTVTRAKINLTRSKATQ